MIFLGDDRKYAWCSLKKTIQENGLFMIQVKNIVLGLILIGFLINIVHFVVLEEFGMLNGPIFFIFSGDPFADFYKSSLSYVSYDLEKFRFMPNIYLYLTDNPYKGFNGLSNVATLTNYHNPPVTVLIKLIQAYMIKGLGPIEALVCVNSVVLFALVYAVNRTKAFCSVYESALIVLFSYPVLFAIFRGNTQSIINSAAIILFLTLVREDKSIFIRNLLMAVAINIRPVSAVFVIFYFFRNDIKGIIKNGALVLVLTLLVMDMSFIVAAHYYNGYGINTFIEGLRHYKSIYLLTPRFLQEEFNTSIYALVKNNGIHSFEIDEIKVWVCLLIVIITVTLKALLKYGNVIFIDLELMYILYCFYVLIFPISADYHMITLIGILSIALREYKNSQKNIVLFLIAVCLISLIPKNFMGGDIYEIFILGHYYNMQFFLNTVLLLSSMLFIILFHVLEAAKQAIMSFKGKVMVFHV